MAVHASPLMQSSLLPSSTTTRNCQRWVQHHKYRTVCWLASMDPLHPPIYASINTTLTPIFVPNPQSVLAIESYYNMVGPGISAAFLYNPLDPNSGIVVDDRGRLAPVLENRWREFERAVFGAQAALQNTWGVESWWSRPQNVGAFIFCSGPWISIVSSLALSALLILSIILDNVPRRRVL